MILLFKISFGMMVGYEKVTYIQRTHSMRPRRKNVSLRSLLAAAQYNSEAKIFLIPEEFLPLKGV